MNIEVSTDPKTVKMFRRLEKFLDDEGLGLLGGSVQFQNAETLDVFAVFLSPESFSESLRERDLLLEQLSATVESFGTLFAERIRVQEELNAALETIAVLEDDSALLDIIDALNDVLQGRCAPKDDAELFDQDATDVGEHLSVHYTFTDAPPAEGQVDDQPWAFIGGIRGVGFPDLDEFHAFTSDAIRREQPFG